MIRYTTRTEYAQDINQAIQLLIGCGFVIVEVVIMDIEPFDGVTLLPTAQARIGFTALDEITLEQARSLIRYKVENVPEYNNLHRLVQYIKAGTECQAEIQPYGEDDQ